MTEETRRSIFRYGIAIDLVILATGVGMLLPLSPRALVVVFAGAVGLAAWKGGWKGAAAAWLLSLIALAFAFPEQIGAPQLIEFGGAALATAAIVTAANVPRTRVIAAQPVMRSNVVAFTAPLPVIDEEEVAREAEERRRLARRLEETAARQLEKLREDAERARRAAEERAAREREAAARNAQEEAQRLAEAQRRAVEDEALRRAEEEHRASEARERERVERQRAEEERLAAERRAAEQELAARLAREREEAERAARTEAERLLAEQRRAEEELAQQLIREREEAQRALQERIEAERRAAEEELRHRLEAERETLRRQMEQQLAAEREAIERDAAARVEAARKAAEEEAAQRVAAEAPKKPAPPPPKKSIVETISQSFSGWFVSAPRQKSVNLRPKKLPPRQPAPVRRSVAVTAKTAAVRKPRLLMIERRRATADTAAPRLRQRGIDVTVVERWVDAVDEIFRARPDAIVIDVEHAEFEKIHRSISDKYSDLPILLSGRYAASAPSGAAHAAFLARPYDVDELVRLAQDAHAKPHDLLAKQVMPRVAAKPAPKAAPPPPVTRPAPVQQAAPAPAPKPASSAGEYLVPCFTCRTGFDAVEADWCSCLAKERTLVCTNCLSCFCKAPPAYKEKFWVEAPPRLFERKTSDARRQQSLLPPNASPDEVKRPLVLTVEDDEEIQAIVHRVCNNLGYGFIYATNGQDGLEIAREYKPNLILSDAFMPKLDGREMCRILKEENGFEANMVVMTGLYTDTKYRSEALKRFHVDDYIAKPVAITDLVNLLQKHLEGITGLPQQEDLHELHRQDLGAADEEPEPFDEDLGEEPGIPLSELLGTPQIIDVHAKPKPAPAPPKSDAYEVCCFNCQNNFDATRADWCTCVGRDQTVVCSHCGGCFCKAPAAYKERFWMDAPPMLFERKMLGSKRHHGERANPTPADVKRPLILLVEDDENVQLIVKTVVTTMGFGFVVGANGQEGLSLAREYNPDLILSDAFMPKLDGREMCRLLKEDPATARSKAIIMTGLYTDRKYRNEALDYFKVDDYVAKPLAVDDLIKLFKKHLPQEVQAAN